MNSGIKEAMVTTNNNVKMDLTGETQRRFNIFDQIRGKVVF